MYMYMYTLALNKKVGLKLWYWETFLTIHYDNIQSGEV